MIKTVFSLLCVLLLVRQASAQASANYIFPVPNGWESEKITFPISFAPDIPFKGTEEVRFTPGWAQPQSDQYWSYVFLWFINGKQQDITAAKMNHYLEQYYQGLYLANLKNKPQPRADFTTTSLQQVSTSHGDNKTFEGTLTMLDFLTGNQIKFYLHIHIRYVADNDTIVLYEVSPKEFKHPVWATLNTEVNLFKTGN